MAVGPLTRLQVMRRYLEHNAMIIHGVPKEQLLVWDVYKEPSWQRLCDFLGVPVPDAPFPRPGAVDM